MKKEKELKITERGWAGHFIGASMCGFRRNTLIEYGNKRIVVSTVGNMSPNKTGDKSIDNNPLVKQIGYNRTYETMAFEAEFVDPYWEANIQKQIPFESDWAISELEFGTDLLANEMHEKIVKELSEKIKKYEKI